MTFFKTNLITILETKDCTFKIVYSNIMETIRFKNLMYNCHFHNIRSSFKQRIIKYRLIVLKENPFLTTFACA